MTAPLVSIITPTFNRPQYLPILTKFVLDQSISDFEWLILDDSPTPSEFMRGISDPRIIYEHAQGKRTAGSKRNYLIQKARADIIAQFDDDDFYGPNYLSNMMSEMHENDTDIVKFFGFFLYSKLYNALGYWDLNAKVGPHWIWSAEPLGLIMMTEQNNQSLKDNHLGYGFSYVFKKKVWERGQFPDMKWNSDGIFMQNAVQHFKLTGIHDVECTCLHVIHGTNLSKCFPQYTMPGFVAYRLFPMAEDLLALEA
jgi:glycosyltransferase involved in cell wall biosynthesis